jgi:hypothetical protein
MPTSKTARMRRLAPLVVGALIGVSIVVAVFVLAA